MRPEINASQYSVVVIGAMNPAIHHPHWYQTVEILTPAEEQQALHSVSIFPQFSQFRVAALRIHCTPDRWQVTTGDSNGRSRIIDLAAETFKHLCETPVSAYGFNAHFDVNVGQNIANTLGMYLARRSPLDFSFNEISPDFESFSLSYSLPAIDVKEQPRVERRLNATVKRSQRASDAMEVDINGHHQIGEPPGTRRFNLDVLVRASANIQETTDLLLKHILTTLSALQE